MDVRDVAVVRTGTANLASVLAGVRRAGGAARMVEDESHARRAPFLVLPGVGTLAAAMREVERSGLVEALRERILEGRPTLAVCLGLQMLGTGSDENPGVAGLGVVRSRISRFAGDVRVPQLGWNHVQPQPGCRLLRAGFAYFANSYKMDDPPEGWRAAFADHGGPFVAALERGDVLACQFHPELSGQWGLALMRRWLFGSEAEPAEVTAEAGAGDGGRSASPRTGGGGGGRCLR
jgi:imidazole glycerol phosphate synthase glutamine amidotransferase subunit